MVEQTTPDQGPAATQPPKPTADAPAPTSAAPSPSSSASPTPAAPAPQAAAPAPADDKAAVLEADTEDGPKQDAAPATPSTIPKAKQDGKKDDQQQDWAKTMTKSAQDWGGQVADINNPLTEAIFGKGNTLENLADKGLEKGVNLAVGAANAVKSLFSKDADAPKGEMSALPDGPSPDSLLKETARQMKASGVLPKDNTGPTSTAPQQGADLSEEEVSSIATRPRS